jgi:hypothetical protein
MSKFLAPIHTWLFNKINLYEELESTLVKAYAEKYGEDAKGIYTEVKDSFGYPLEAKPIEELIDVTNIHGWLQNKISIAETRQAALITRLHSTYGEEVKNIAINLYSEQGSECGKDAKQKYEVNNAPEIYQALNNYILEGMPCDRANVITENSGDKVEWKNEMCLHIGYWESVQGNIALFYELRDSWIKSFVENVNNNFTYNANRNESTFEIVKK